ncbi:MAG: permease, partial [Limisphaerales bacterium]
ATSVRLIENAIVGPLIAVASLVCSVGNIPLASLLWSGGISFGGVISFIYADLIIIPLILAYRKYYGTKAALYITAVMFVSMVIAGIVVDLLFGACGLIPTVRPPSAIAQASFQWNYTTWLDFVAIAISGWLVWIHFKKAKR